mmetsp:Transcript_51497/g.112107  ORF Transcript_51497/g.112107 Transcript_51497/m.112107 type:complete len:1145 (+) Transcript_51497:70-3504(+)
MVNTAWTGHFYYFSKSKNIWLDHGALEFDQDGFDTLGLRELSDRLEVRRATRNVRDGVPVVRARVSFPGEGCAVRARELRKFMDHKNLMLECEAQSVNILRLGGTDDQVEWAELQARTQTGNNVASTDTPPAVPAAALADPAPAPVDAVMTDASGGANTLKRTREDSLVSDSDSARPAPPPPPNGERAPPASNGDGDRGAVTPLYSLSVGDLTEDGTARPRRKDVPVVLPYPPPARPGYGTLGRPIQVKTNFAQVVLAGNAGTVRVLHYDIKWDFAREARDGTRKPLEATISTMKNGERSTMLPWKELQEKLRLLCERCSPVHDNFKNLYTCEELVLTPRAAEKGWSGDGRKLSITLPGCGKSQNQEWVLSLLKTDHDMPINELFVGSANGAIAVQREQQRDMMSALDIIMKHDAFLLYKQVGDAFYDERQQAAWAKITQLGKDQFSGLWFGYRQSIVMTDKGPMMQQDRAGTVLTISAKVLEFIATFLNTRPERLQMQDFQGRRVHQNLMFGNKKWKLKVMHSKNVYTMQGVDDKPLSERMFLDSEVGHEVSVADYFERKYPQFPLKFKHLPGVLAGPKADPTKNVLPIELCSFLSGQPTNQRSPDITKIMIEHMCQKPPERFRALEQLNASARQLCSSDRSAAKSFNLELSPLCTANARILPPCSIFYKNRSRREERVTMGRDGASWNLRGSGNAGDLGFQEVPDRKLVHAAVDFVTRTNEQQAFMQFLRDFFFMSRERGINFKEERPRIVGADARRSGGRDDAAQAAELLNMLTEREKPDLVICLLPGNQSENAKALYPAIKRWSASCGIATQCIQLAAMKKNCNPKGVKSYIAGVLLKVNLKLGGKNGFVGESVHASRSGLPLMAAAPTIVFGADVHHASPGSQQPSYAAVVASLDESCTAFHTVVNRQESRTETLTNLESTIEECLREYVKKRPPPKRLFFLRDGVAHNQFGTSKEGGMGPVQQEIGQIFSACKKVLGASLPSLVYIVVQKKNRCRLATTAFQNVPPGTVVDSNITEASAYDFYMVPHTSLMKGTCQPSHFHVVYDDLKLGPDEVQAFMYQLCHAYGRATKVVSRPAPVYYAHLAAFHASFYNVKYKADPDLVGQWETASTASGSHASTTSAGEDIQVAPVLKNILHYV